MIANINRRNVNCNINMGNKGTFVSNSHPYVTSIGGNYLGDTYEAITNPYQVAYGFPIHADLESNRGRQRVQFYDHVTYNNNRATMTTQTDTIRTNG